MIKCLLICVSLVLSVSCRPSDQMSEAEFSNYQFTLERLNEILKAYEPYKQFFPDYVWDPIDKLSDDQKKSFVQLVNDYHAGHFEPKNYQEFLAVLKKSYPNLADMSETMYNKYQEQVSKLGPKAQAFSADMEKQLYIDASPDRIVWACHLFNNAKNVVSQAKELLNDADEEAKIQEAFPEAVTFMKSKEFEAYSIVVKELKPLDCEKDRQQIFNTIRMFDMHGVILKKD